MVVKLIQILKRTFYIFITCINFIWAFPFLLILRIVKPLILIKFTTILTSRIGHFAIDSSFYLATLPKSSGFPKIYHWFWFSPGISNLYWSSLVRRYLFVHPWVKYLDYLNYKLPGGKSHIVPALPASRDKDGIFQREIERFSISKHENELAKSWMRKFGWTDGEPFVCLLVRDSEYLISDPNNKSFADSRENWTYHSYRDSDIDTYVKGIEYFLERGYWVIRMGKICAKPVSIRNSKFIDYPFLDNQDDLLDIWLTLNAKLFISTGTGIDILPNVYKVPVSLYLNALPLINLNSSHHMTWVPKYLIWKSTGKYLTLKEHLSNHHLETLFYEDAGIQVVDLTSQDILDAIQEQEQRLLGSWVDTDDDLNRQKCFWEILKKFPEFSIYHNWIHPEARVGTHFLRKMGDAFFE